MNYEMIVYLMVGWFVFTTVLFMITMLWISKIEIRNSRNNLRVKLAIHYSSIFNGIKIVFRKYESIIIHGDESVYKTDSGLISDYDKSRKQIESCIVEISELLGQHSVNNRFLFITDKALNELLIIGNKDLVSLFQEWSFAVSEIDSRINEYKVIVQMDKDDSFDGNKANKFDERVDAIPKEIREMLNLNYIRYTQMIEMVINIHSKLANDSFSDIFN